MSREKLKVIGASLVILAAAVVLYISLEGFPPSLNPKPHEALGQVVAEETIKLVGSGGRVFVINRDTVTFKNPAADLQLQSFSQTLKQAKIPIAGAKVIKMNPIRLVAVPGGDFLEFMKKCSDADVIVSFLGPPVLTPEQISRLGDQRPKIVAVCSGSMPAQIDLKALFGQKVLHVAIVSRKDAPAAPGAPASLRSWFDQLYLLITPANLAELAGSHPTSPR